LAHFYCEAAKAFGASLLEFLDVQYLGDPIQLQTRHPPLGELVEMLFGIRDAFRLIAMPLRSCDRYGARAATSDWVISTISARGGS
jgi:hypothetical protein